MDCQSPILHDAAIWLVQNCKIQLIMHNTSEINIEILGQIAGICVWKKDTQGNFLDMNECFAQTLGFHTPSDAVGKNDYDLPTGLSKFADIFRDADNKVMTQKRPFKFLEIQPYANEEWKALYVIKSPLIENNEIIGTLGFAIDVSHLFAAYDDYIQLGRIDSALPMPSFRKEHKNKLMLSNRQIECLSLLGKGKTIKEIAKILDLSPRTVEDYLNSVKIKLGCRNIQQLMSHSLTLGITPTSYSSHTYQQLSIIIGD